jgi:hypothetical protein
MNHWHRELIKRLEGEGVAITAVHHRTSSIALDCALGERTMRYFTGITPSDRRAMDNAFHGIMRTLKTKEPFNVAPR